LGIINKQASTPSITAPSTLLQDLPNFSSLFRFDHRLKTLEANFSEFTQTNQFARAVSSIIGIVQRYMDQRINEAVKVAVQIQSDRLRDEAQAEKDKFLKTIDKNMQKIIKEQVKEQVKVQISNILPKIEQTVNEQLEAEVLTRSSNSSKTSYAIAADLLEMELKKIVIEKMEGNKDVEMMMRIKMKNPLLDQTGGPRDEGKERSQKLEFFLEEVYKVTTYQLDWVNPEGQQYPHNPLKPLPLIPNSQGRRVIPFDHFINNDLEYIRRGASSRKYTTSVTKTKAADYGHINWIKDLVPRTMWIQEPRRIIAITELKIVKWHNCKHLDWITVRRDNDKLYKFKEDDRLKGICMKYLTQSIWRKSNKERAATMIQAIDKQLKTRRIMRSLERFVCGRLYEGDFRMLQRTI
nr:hypothetical protein [Tanacetum cinerariifolium]